MREDPGLDACEVAASLGAHYGLRVLSVVLLPLGYDPYAAVYRVGSREGDVFFLKVKFGPVHEPGLRVPRALIEGGVPNVLAPLRTRSGDLWCPLDGRPDCNLVLHPFVEGESAMVSGLSDEQWREFGRTLRAVHDGGFGKCFRGLLPAEAFSLPSAAPVWRLLALVHEKEFEGEAAAGLAAFWRGNAGRIERILARAEELGGRLRARPFELVLCHADIHAANIIVGDDGRLYLIDWDGPLVAPRERDLLFVVGSKIARAVEPSEEALFFEGYGPVEIDPDALIYFRYERIIEDIGEFGKSVFLRPDLGERARAEEAGLVRSFFAPGNVVERAETVIPSWPRTMPA